MQLLTTTQGFCYMKLLKDAKAHYFEDQQENVNCKKIL